MSREEILIAHSNAEVEKRNFQNAAEKIISRVAKTRYRAVRYFTMAAVLGIIGTGIFFLIHRSHSEIEN